MGRKKKASNLYFTTETENAIVQFNEMTQSLFRDKLFEQKIYPAFDKMAENLIHTFKFYYIDESFQDLKTEIVQFMTEKIHHYDQSKAKAFSFFSVISKRRLIILNDKAYRDKSKFVDSLDYIDEERDLTYEERREDVKFIKKRFMDQFVEWLNQNAESLFDREKDLKICYAILHIMKNRDDLEIFNKKAIYILIREMTNESTNNISSVLKIIKSEYYKKFNTYQIQYE